MHERLAGALWSKLPAATGAVQPTRLRVALAILVAFNGGLLALLVLRPLSAGWLDGIDNCAQFVGPLIALPWALGGSGTWWRRSNERDVPGPGSRAPVYLGAGVLCFGLGQIVWTWYELVLHQATPFPSLADVFFLLEYPFLTVGVLMLPQRRLSPAAMSRVTLDACMVLCAAVTFSWYFVLGPTLFQGGESALARIVGTAYPIWDLVLVAALFVIVAQARHAVSGRVQALLTLGLLTTVVSDTLFDLETLHGTYSTGTLFDIGWPLACMLICLAAQMVREEERDGKRDAPGVEAQRSHWTTLLPYTLVPAVGGLLLYVGHFAPDTQFRPGVEIGSGLLVLLVVFRQVLALEENRVLSGRLRAQNAELAQANTRLEALATTDPHTGLSNHRAMVSALDTELERSFRYHRPCALLFVDLDHFKRLNDTHGHLAGDGVLAEVAGVMRQAVRGVDMVGRWGGEEFIILLPETDVALGLEVAERVRATVAAHHCLAAGRAHVTCSIGVASYPRHGDERETFIERADRAMYAAKKLGRNQVRTADDPVIDVLAEDGVSVSTQAETDLIRTVEALSVVVEARDLMTGAHLREVSRLSMQVALALGLGAEEARRIELAAKLHDIGKISIPDSVLSKPGHLSPDEWVLMRRHAAAGADIVDRFPGLSSLAPIIRGHHERWDGTGYPDGLSGERIPLGARIVAAVDAFSAMTADRPYRRAINSGDAREELRWCAGAQFDPQVVASLERVLEVWSNGERLAG